MQTDVTSFPKRFPTAFALTAAFLCFIFPTPAQSQADPQLCKKLTAAAEALQNRLEQLQENLSNEECQGSGKIGCQRHIKDIEAQIAENSRRAKIACVEPTPPPPPHPPPPPPAGPMVFTPAGGPIVDEGYPGMRQLADVNGDGVLDYCRFVGDAPEIFLSCQLGNRTSGYWSDPYAFNSIKGIDQGIPGMPQALIDINKDGRADFCRYVKDVSVDSGAAGGAILVCNLAGTTGFAAEQINPLAYMSKGDKLELFMASGGTPTSTPISFISNATTGEWYAYGTDADGRRLRMEGKTWLTHQPGFQDVATSETELFEYDKTEYIYMKHSKNQEPTLTTQTIWDSSGHVNFVIKGGYPKSYKGFEYSQLQFVTSVGYSSVHLTVWACGNVFNPVCIVNFGGKLFPNADKPQWEGKIPQSFGDYLPDTINLITYFQPMFDRKTTEMDALFQTGVAWFDAKHWYEHTSSEWGSVQSELTQNAKDRIRTINNLTSLGKFFAGVAGSAAGVALGWGTPFGGLMGSAIGGYAVYLVGWEGQQAVDAITRQDAQWCKAIDYKWEGCGAKPETLPGVPQN